MNRDFLEIYGDILDDAIQALIDWANFEADMATNPYDD